MSREYFHLSSERKLHLLNICSPAEHIAVFSLNNFLIWVLPLTTDEETSSTLNNSVSTKTNSKGTRQVPSLAL